MKSETDYYLFANIRTLLTESYNIDELLTFCFDSPTFRHVYDNWSKQNTKNDLVRSIIDYGFKRLEVETILAWVKNDNPARYEEHQPYFVDRSKKSPTLNVSVLPSNHLGNGIHLGGEYRKHSLQIAATEWTDYGDNRQIRSGWLFIPQWTSSHALTFFKIHVFEHGNGYIHLTDTSAPAHKVFLKTEAGVYLEKQFHYELFPSDTWEFFWK